MVQLNKYVTFTMNRRQLMNNKIIAYRKKYISLLILTFFIVDYFALFTHVYVSFKNNTSLIFFDVVLLTLLSLFTVKLIINLKNYNSQYIIINGDKITINYFLQIYTIYFDDIIKVNSLDEKIYINTKAHKYVINLNLISNKEISNKLKDYFSLNRT